MNGLWPKMDGLWLMAIILNKPYVQMNLMVMEWE